MMITTPFGLDQMMLPMFMTFFPTVLYLSLGFKVVIAMIIYGISKEGHNLSEKPHKQLFDDIIKFIVQS